MFFHSLVFKLKSQSISIKSNFYVELVKNLIGKRILRFWSDYNIIDYGIFLTFFREF